MAVNTTQTKYFQNIGVGADQLRFSQIATTMGLDGSSNIRFGDYRRKTGADEVFADVDGSPDEKNAATAIVPDSEENRTCGVDLGGISEANNHKVSSLKNMIKRWDVSYTGGSTSERTLHAGGNVVGDANWGNNLDRNIPKRFTIDGSTYKASSTSQHALFFSDEALNLEFKFQGTTAKGKEGAGGSSGGGNGGSAGSALYLRNNTNRTTGNAKTIKLDISNNSLIAGGGGGGGGGNSGNISGTQICQVGSSNNHTSGSWRRSCPSSCRPCNHGGGRYFRGHGGFSQGTIYYAPWNYNCSNISYVGGNNPNTRAGGAGGAGAGSNRTNPQGGSSGQNTVHGNCNQGSVHSYRYANAGGAGASGGSLGSAGGNAAGSGGAKGRWLNASNTPWQHIGSSSNSILKGGVQ